MPEPRPRAGCDGDRRRGTSGGGSCLPHPAINQIAGAH